MKKQGPSTTTKMMNKMIRHSITLLSLFLLIACGSSEEVRVILTSPVIPVLSGKPHNPVQQVTLVRHDTAAYTLEQVTLTLSGSSDPADITEIMLFASDGKGRPDTGRPLGSSRAPAGKVIIPTHLTVDADTLSFWVTVTLREPVDLTHRVAVRCSEIVTDKGKVKIATGNGKPLRTGVALRRHNQEGVHTSRIPGLATSKQGTLLAIFDARYESARDLQGDMDIGLHRSLDGGHTWEPMQVVLDMNEWGGLPEKYNGVSDACILVDEKSGDIYVAGLWMHGLLDRETGKWVEGLTADSTRWIHQWQAKGSQPGFGVKETSQFLLTKSSDDGLTWGKPVNLTHLKKEEWWLFAPAPGHGITLSDGTLVLPTQGRDSEGKPFSNITWSKDGGETWSTSNPAATNTTECMAVELNDGSIMLNMRDNRNRGNDTVNGRTIATTADLGTTWNEHPTSRKALIEPTCMASIHRHHYREKGEEKSLLLFVNPASTSKRNNITLKVSCDDGNSWPEEKQILLDELSGRGYSCITSVDEETIGILYESSQSDMVFQTIKLKEIL